MERRARRNELRAGIGAVAVVAAALGACNSDPDPASADALARLLAPAESDSAVTLASGDTVRVSPATIQFYRARGWQPAWTGRWKLNMQGRALHEAVGRAPEDGLSPDPYAHELVERMLAQPEQAARERRRPDSVAVSYLVGADILLTEGFYRFARDLATGTLDPQRAGIDWLVPGKPPVGEQVLKRVATGQAPTEVVAQLRPGLPYYERMRDALARYHAVRDRGGWPSVPEHQTIEPGTRSAAVAALRARLLHGADAEEARLAGWGAADPTFYDEGLKQAVQRFQLRHAIEDDGAVGEDTLIELNRTVEERIDELSLNLDRWRWLPDQLGDRYVLVNIAGFELELVDEGRAVMSMNVVVGQLDRPTPAFADSIRFIVVNPSWYVPPTIMREDVLPAVQRDPGYLARNNMEMVGGGIRQRPGPNNPLGRFKFMFPNDHDIYLHDSPQNHLFSRARRDFSSGCIRVERPYDLASAILDMQTDAGAARLDPLLEHWHETSITLDRPLPVYLLYFTAWVEEDGTVRFHNDVYGSDAQLEKQMEQRRQGRVPAAHTTDPDSVTDAGADSATDGR